jgi:glycerate kinase
LLKAVIEDGVDDLFVALGGTGTVDGGRGLLAVLPSLPPTVTLTALVDVQAPLGGPEGARRFFGQKGVPAGAFDDVEAALCALHPAFIDTPGAGAAGGLGAAMLALGGTLVSGADFIMEACDVEGAVVACDVVVGGEGSVDVTTTFGKSLWRLRALARKHHTPFIVVCGHCDLPTVDVGDAVLELGEAGLRDARGAIAAIGPSLLAAIDRATDVVTPSP